MRMRAHCSAPISAYSGRRLFVILDSPFSGKWVTQLRDAALVSDPQDPVHNVAIQACCSGAELAYEDPETGGQFSNVERVGEWRR